MKLHKDKDINTLLQVVILFIIAFIIILVIN